MRLLNTTTLTFEEFFDAERPKYSILSHRWGRDEVSYLDFCEGRMRAGAGYQKIAKCCEISARQGLNWCWIDTCCIDKRSSAELTEAVNSMYQWYRDAFSCYVFLPDVHASSCETQTSTYAVYQESDRTAPFLLDELRQSVWFSRGWTLQELLAPATLVIFNSSYSVISTQLKEKGTMGDAIRKMVSTESGIEERILERREGNRKGIAYEAGIAECMKWASRRETTRKEDMAYCLLGIFDVNMPLLYGEGDKAFTRLQLEILKKTDDDSIFAWTHPRGGVGNPGGLLATSPRYFHHEGIVCRGTNFKYMEYPRAPYVMTGKGLELQIYFPELTGSNGMADGRYTLIEYELEQSLWKGRNPYRLSIRLYAHQGHQSRIFPTNSKWQVLRESGVLTGQTKPELGWDLPTPARSGDGHRPKGRINMLQVRGHGPPTMFRSTTSLTRSSPNDTQKIYFKRAECESKRWVLTKIYVPQDGL